METLSINEETRRKLDFLEWKPPLKTSNNIKKIKMIQFVFFLEGAFVQCKLFQILDTAVASDIILHVDQPQISFPNIFCSTRHGTCIPSCIDWRRCAGFCNASGSCRGLPVDHSSWCFCPGLYRNGNLQCSKCHERKKHVAITVINTWNKICCFHEQNHFNTQYCTSRVLGAC